MDFEAYLGSNSNYQLPTEMDGEIMHPMSSDIVFQDGMLSPTLLTSHMDSSFGNQSLPTAAVSLSPQFFSTDMNPGVVINNPYFDGGMEKNAMLTNIRGAAPVPDGSYRINNSVNLPYSSFGTNNIHSAAASLNPQLFSNKMNPGALISNPYFEASMENNAIVTGYRSAAPVLGGSYRTNSGMNIPSSSLAANNLNVATSLCLDHLVVPHQLSQPVQCQLEQHKRQHNQLSILSPMAQSMLQGNQFSAPSMQFDDVAQMQKKPRLEYKMDENTLRYMIQQLLLSENSKLFTSHDLKLAASPREYQMINALLKATIPSLPERIEAHCQRLMIQQQLTNCQKQGLEPQVPQTSVIDINGITCAARLMQYLHHQRSRPKQNSIAYWRKFVAEYFASDAKKRWCFSHYDHVGHGAFSHAALDSWSCDICGTKSGRGFEVTFEVLPRLCKVNLEGGIADELLYLDSPLETKLPLGHMMLHYTKAVQETMYNHARVIHEGQLRVTFTKELKITSWEFCARHHEEFVPRRLIAPQVNQLIHAAQKHQDNIELNKSEGSHRNALQATNNRFVKTGGQLAKTLESQIVTDCGFSKQFVRFFQIADVLDSMKDLMTYSQENNLSPIESLNRYAQETKFKQKQMDEKALYENAQAFSSTGNKLMLMSPVPATNPFVESIVLNSGAESSAAWTTTAGSNYYQRHVMGNANSNGISSNNGSSQEPNSRVQASRKLLPGSSTTSSTSMMVKPGPSWCEASPPSAYRSITTQPGSSNGSQPTISFTQGDQETRKHVLNKLMMERVLSSGAPQGPQPPMTPNSALTSGAKGRNEAISRAGGGSQRKSTSKRTPSKGPRSSSTRDQSSSRINTGNSTWKFKGHIKTEEDVPEEYGLPLLPGVKVKKEAFYG